MPSYVLQKSGSFKDKGKSRVISDQGSEMFSSFILYPTGLYMGYFWGLVRRTISEQSESLEGRLVYLTQVLV